MSNNEDSSCQRFFAFSKRVPKDVKRFCGICRQHGKMEETRGHICEFKDCECQKCNLVRSRRLVMSQQIRLRRAQDKRFQRTDRPEEADVIPLLTPQFQQQLERSASPQPPNGLIIDEETQQQMLDINGKNMCYFCQKCKNHGVLVWKKQHKRQCPFTNCSCDFCELIETRRRLDQHLVVARHKIEGYGKGKSRKLNLQKEEENNNNIKSNSEDEENNILSEEPPKKKSTISINLEENENACTSSEAKEENNKLQKEPLEALNEQIWRIQNQQQISPKDIKSRNSSFSSIESFSTSREVSAAPLINEQQQKQQQPTQQFFNSNTNLLIPQNDISSSFLNILPNFLPNERQQQLTQTNQNSLDQFILNCLNQTILPKPSLISPPNSKILQQNSENGNLINENENEFQKNILLQIIAQLLQEQQKSKIAETIIGAQHQALLRNLILTGNNNRNTEMFPQTFFDPTIFATNFLAAQQGLLPKNNEEQQQLQIQSAFNILQSGFGLL